MMTIKSGLDEGQVLQRLGPRGANTRVKGNASEAGPVLATLSNRKGVLTGWKARLVGACARGRFTVELKGIPAGGPYRLKLERGRESVTRRHFFVGDVWLMAGQSNMQGVGDMDAPAQPHPLIRVFSMRREWKQAADPLHVLPESPDACHNGGNQCSPEQGEKERLEAKKGVGVGIFFARERLKHTGVPQGLIATAHSGTSMTQWNPDLQDQGGNSLYGSMRLSLQAAGQPLAGVIWYQGENDVSPGDTPLYTERMRKLVAAVRRDLRQPRLPWAIVQLSRVCGDNDAVNWNRIQEQQRLLPGEIRHLETVSAIDLPLDDGVHIGAAGFPRLGLRLAGVARQLLEGGKNRPPQLEAITLMKNARAASGPSIDVVFGSVEGDLQADGVPQGFTLVNSEGKIVPIIYKTTLHGKIVRLHCCRSLTPDLFLHYGHGLLPCSTIMDARGFALPVFGPLPLFKPAAYLPFVNTWKATGIVTTSQSLRKIRCPDLEALKAPVKTYAPSWGLEGFVNEHLLWQGHSGHAYFASRINLSESMRLRFLMGYDGPFRLWVDGRILFEDIHGTNPCFADQSEKSIALSVGSHRITVAMDLAEGKTWGFLLRFIREDVMAEQIKMENYVHPSYSA